MATTTASRDDHMATANDMSANVRFRPSQGNWADDGGGVWSPPSWRRVCADDAAAAAALGGNSGEARSLAVEERRGSPPKVLAAAHCPLRAHPMARRQQQRQCIATAGRALSHNAFVGTAQPWGEGRPR
ncbi:hypothetical protein GRF29_1g921784 [Pseudopithomyces chartarum]|uniref:Uncharacterized protein n=1 Tax=Pseudopithomyces chartarum TaxID=1892770 RepID=A0AAN6M961_9PLEO|nr:hypothetical protein GRF29_1g921784 [Pseudopithomyces chartarum]